MDRAVVVFAFPEPQEGYETGLALIVESAKTLFKGIEQVKVYVAIKEPAQTVISVFEGEDDSENTT